jgi:hypothetical protein
MICHLSPYYQKNATLALAEQQESYLLCLRGELCESLRANLADTFARTFIAQVPLGGYTFACFWLTEMLRNYVCRCNRKFLQQITDSLPKIKRKHTRFNLSVQDTLSALKRAYYFFTWHIEQAIVPNMSVNSGWISLESMFLRSRNLRTNLCSAFSIRWKNIQSVHDWPGLSW